MWGPKTACLFDAILHVRRVDLAQRIPAHHSGRAPDRIGTVDDRVLRMQLPVEAVSRGVEMPREALLGLCGIGIELCGAGFELCQCFEALIRILLIGVDEDASFEIEPVFRSQDVVVFRTLEFHQSQIGFSPVVAVFRDRIEEALTGLGRD